MIFRSRSPSSKKIVSRPSHGMNLLDVDVTSAPDEIRSEEGVDGSHSTSFRDSGNF